MRTQDNPGPAANRRIEPTGPDWSPAPSNKVGSKPDVPEDGAAIRRDTRRPHPCGLDTTPNSTPSHPPKEADNGHPCQ
jgi:hypothetical protein